MVSVTMMDKMKQKSLLTITKTTMFIPSRIEMVIVTMITMEFHQRTEMITIVIIVT